MSQIQQVDDFWVIGFILFLAFVGLLVIAAIGHFLLAWLERRSLKRYIREHNKMWGRL